MADFYLLPIIHTYSKIYNSKQKQSTFSEEVFDFSLCKQCLREKNEAFKFIKLGKDNHEV